MLRKIRRNMERNGNAQRRDRRNHGKVTGMSPKLSKAQRATVRASRRHNWK